VTYFKAKTKDAMTPKTDVKCQ